MRFLWIVSVLFFMLTSSLAYGEVKQNTFTEKEIQKMAETKAVIETKFGNIELKFFPEVAPNHVNNFIELAKKGFYDGKPIHSAMCSTMEYSKHHR